MYRRLSIIAMPSGTSCNMTERHEPPLQLGEARDRFVLRMLLPGLKNEDLRLMITGNTLTISGYIAPMTGLYHRQARPCGRFCRSVKLESRVRQQDITAELKAGVLTVTLPKLVPGGRQRIPVETL